MTTAERVTAAERAGFDLAELARRVRDLAELRGIEGLDRLIPQGTAGAHLAPGQRAAVLTLAALAEALAAELQGEPRPAGGAVTVAEAAHLAELLGALRAAGDDSRVSVRLWPNGSGLLLQRTGEALAADVGEWAELQAAAGIVREALAAPELPGWSHRPS